MNSKIKENFKRIIFFSIFFFVGSVIFISLISSNPDDNSFLRFDSKLEKPGNYLGLFGSILSEFLINFFGIVSYFLCLFFFINSFKVIAGKYSSWKSWTFLPLTIVLLCFVVQFIVNNNEELQFSSGIIGNGLNIYFNYYSQNFDYAYLLITAITFFLLLTALLSLNFGYNDVINLLIVLYKNFLNLIILVAKLFNLKLSLNWLKFYDIKANINESSLKDSVIKRKSKRRALENYIFPSIDLLEKEKRISGIDAENKRNTEVNRTLLAGVLKDFKISGQITDVRQGPIVTLFELTPAPGTLSSSVIRLSEDIARSMSAKSTRISTIPGKDAIGIEIPNKQRQIVFLRELINHEIFRNNKFKLPLALGKDIFGNPVIVDLAKMPHLLVAGTTGSGKSVGINAMLLSLLYYLSPEDCRLILIDPKMLELSIYQDIPHLLTEVVTDPKKAISALKWTVKEMEKRYQMMTYLEVREIDDYNKKVKKIIENGQVLYKEMQVGYDSETGKPVMEKKALDLTIFPNIVVVVDELADLMITSGKEIEGAIQRLSQMARAAGIHLIVATQRPSVDVITGTIKSNFPTRISYKVVNKINSRTILEEQGAEQLLGQGDLLITMLGENLLRVHGPFVRTEEVQSVVNHLKTQGEPEYLQTITLEESEHENFNLGLSDGGDELYDKAVSIVCREKRASTSFIQRHLQIGYNRAARIIEKMESEGIVSPANHVGRREVLVGKDN